MLHANWHLHYCITKYPHQRLNITNTTNTTTINGLVNTKQRNKRCNIRHLISPFHHKMAVYTSVLLHNNSTVYISVLSTKIYTSLLLHQENQSLHFSPTTLQTLVHSSVLSHQEHENLYFRPITPRPMQSTLQSHYTTNIKVYTSVLQHQEH